MQNSKMKKVSNHKLIEGIFEPEEAKKLLNSLINKKINFHSLEDFSNLIRFNKDAAHSKKRIEELNEMKSLIQIVIEQALEEKLNLDIECSIKISLK
jgi:hypothetical protein